MDTREAVFTVHAQRPDLLPVLRALLSRPETFTVDDLEPDDVAFLAELGLIERAPAPAPDL